MKSLRHGRLPRVALLILAYWRTSIFKVPEKVVRLGIHVKARIKDLPFWTGTIASCNRIRERAFCLTWRCGIESMEAGRPQSSGIQKREGRVFLSPSNVRIPWL